MKLTERHPCLVMVLVPVGLVVLAFCLFPFTFLLEVPVILALGWPWYLVRVIPNLKPDPWVVATAVLCFAGVTLGAHACLRWVYSATSPESRRWPWRWTGLCVGLVVLVFVAGIAFVGVAHQTAWILFSPEPLMRSGREAAPRVTSSNNMKQMGVAVHLHQENTKPPAIPRSTFDATGRPMHSWQTSLLPYIEQEKLYQQIDRTKLWNDPVNAEPLGRRVKPFMHPSLPSDSVNSYGVSHYAGNVHVLMSDRPRTLESFSAGTSNTILAGEVSSNFRAWGDPLNVRDPRLGGNGHPQGFGGPNGRPALLLMLAGSVRTFDPKEVAEFLAKTPE